MVPADDLTSDREARLRRLYEAKARAELKSADALLGAPVTVAAHGDVLADVIVLKGAPDGTDRAARRALAGADGEAALKALAGLGLDPEAVFLACTRPLPADATVRARRLELLVEAVDPRIVVALDPQAAEDLAAAFGLRGLSPAQPAGVRGRTLGAVGDLGASLADPPAKARVWAAFKAVAKAAAST